MRAVFRADASPALGGGHVVRCLTLARALERLGWQCAFAVNSEAADTVAALAGSDVTVVTGTAAGQAAGLRKHWPQGVDWLIVDHYGLDADFEEACRPWAQRLLVIDDLADRPHHCDLLLDHTHGREAVDYDGRRPPGTRLLLGSDYALLRRDFARARQGSLARRTGTGAPQRVLVNLGATDPQNHCLVALRAIIESGLDLAVDVVFGAGAPHREALRKAVAGMAMPVRLHVETDQMPALMAEADLAIGAAGTAAWERCCLGLPTLMIVVADNQRQVAASLSAAGAAEVVSGEGDTLVARLAAALRRLADDRAALAAMSERAAALCDGRGCDRATLALVAPGQASNGRAVTLRLAGPADEKQILSWQQHPTTRRFARQPAPPGAAEHHAWFQARLADPDCLLTVIMHGSEPAGVLRLDPALSSAGTAGEPAYEISILTAPEHRGLGLAGEALALARRWQGRAAIVAEVLPGNDASAALFRKAGYTPGPGGLLYSRPDRAEAALSG